MPYVDIETIERELPFEPFDLGVDDSETDADGNTAWDNLLIDARDGAEDRVNTWTGTTFELLDETVQTERPAHVDDRDLPLENTPIDGVTSITVDGTDLPTGDVIVHDTHLELAASADFDEWPTDRRSVEVSFTYGYQDPPQVVVDAVVRLARARLDRVQSDGLESESPGDGSSVNYRLPAELQRDVRATVREATAPTYGGGAMYV